MLVMVLPCCGSLKLSGDPPSSICGNSQRETGEECDGEAEFCDTHGCGGGSRQCLPDCTWGECREDSFGVLAGPLLTSAGVNSGLDNHLLWTGAGFNIVSTGKYDPESADDELFLSRLTPDGVLEGGPSLITPPTRPGVYFFLLSTMTTGDFPMAILFDAQAGPPRTVFNLFDLEGTPRWDMGVAIFGDDIFPTAMDMASSREGTIGLTINRVQKSFVVFDAGGSIMNESPLECQGTEFARGGLVVAEESGFTVLINCAERDQASAPNHFRLQQFDSRGVSVFGPQEIPGDFDIGNIEMAAANDGEIGVVFMFGSWEEDQENADLIFFVAGDDGSMILPPRRIGQVSVSVTAYGSKRLDITWNGHEYAATWVEAVSGPEDPEPEKSRINVLRISRDGSDIAQPIHISSELVLHTPDIEWSGSAYGLSWMESPHESPWMQNNSWFALVGCGPPED